MYVKALLVRKDDLQLILKGLDEHWIMYPEHKPAIERLQRAVDGLTEKEIDHDN